MSKKFGLGKGLSALIPAEEINTDSTNNNSVNKVPINSIKNNSKQPRKSFDNDKIVELSESIKNHGVVQPIILRKENDDYVIVAGERRWRAAKLAGLKEVPAIIMELTDSDVLEISLIENIQRQDLNPLEEAVAYQRLLDEMKLTQDELSKRLGKSRTAIANTMRLLKLCEAVKEYIIEGVITEGHGRALLPIEDEKLQEQIAQKIIDDNLSVREVEKYIKNLKNQKDSKDDTPQEDTKNDVYYKDIKDRLQDYFGTRVAINSKKDKGKIEIEYYSQEDLQRILDIINL